MKSADDTIIRCHRLTKHYRKGKRTVTPLEGLDLSVRRGRFVAFMGPSGSGKTTLLNLIAGIDTPSEGELEVCGTDMMGLSGGRLARWRAHHVGYIFQLYHLVPVLSAFENVELPLLLSDVPRRERKERVERTLALVRMQDRMHHFPRELSGGQEQRVAIARALVASPPLLVADEPTGDLDREAGDAILALLRELAAEHNKTIVMVTHDPHAAAAADKTMHLEKGRLVDGNGGGEAGDGG